MPARETLLLAVALIVLGSGWGLTMPLTKIAVSGTHRQFGIIFWQMIISAMVLAPVAIATGRRLSLAPRALGLYLLIACLGTLMPNAASFTGALYLPGGYLAILISGVPFFAYPIALALGSDRFTLRRLAGLSLGFAGVLLIALPGTGTLGPGLAVFMALPLLAALCYATEGNVVSRLRPGAPDAVQLLLGGALVGAPLAGIMAVALGQFIDPHPPYGADDWAVIASSAVHGAVYASYFALVARAGAVFASQVGYVVTLTGVGWSMLLLGERFSPGVWLAVLLILGGVSLVQPRRRQLVPGRAGL